MHANQSRHQTTQSKSIVSTRDVSLDESRYALRLESGRLARFADGAAVVAVGDTAVSCYDVNLI